MNVKIVKTQPGGTYVYCLVASARAPSLAGAPSGLPKLGRPRLLEIESGRWLVAATAPLSTYDEAGINSRLSDLDWVARAAIAHEAVTEFFIGATAVVPMKLFTIFSSDERALEDVRRDRRRISTVLARVSKRVEWGVRVVLDPAALRRKPTRRSAAASTGAGYLQRKRAQRDARAELAARARETVSDLYDRLSRRATLSKRRAAGDLPLQNGPLLLDAAFLVPVSRTASFRALARREAASLARSGYRATLTGPWPPYSFIQD